MRPITSPGDSELNKVSELIDNTNACWREELLLATFLPVDVEAIMKIPISTINQEDQWAWSFEGNGMFTV